MEIVTRGIVAGAGCFFFSVYVGMFIQIWACVSITCVFVCLILFFTCKQSAWMLCILEVGQTNSSGTSFTLFEWRLSSFTFRKLRKLGWPVWQPLTVSKTCTYHIAAVQWHLYFVDISYLCLARIIAWLGTIPDINFRGSYDEITFV